MLEHYKCQKEVERKIDKKIVSILEKMETMEPYTEEYKKCAEALAELIETQQKKGHRRVSPDTLATILANSAWILLILKYEESDSILSKAFGFVLKGRV